MSTELDHVFMCVSEGGDEASALTEVGLSEGPPNVHLGQGTACRRFPFRNAYIELLWVSDPAEAQSTPIRPTYLWERWSGRRDGACPFGMGFRPSIDNVAEIPFPAWEYRPPYLPESWCFHVGTNAGVLTEPMLFYLPFGRRPDSYHGDKRRVLEHAAGFREITHVVLVSPCAANLSAAFRTGPLAHLISVRTGPEYVLEIGFDGVLQGKRVDLRPRLPFVFRW
jgi:hypothetical protein